MGFRDKAPAWAYTKSKGLYAGVALDGTVIVERKDENERFYGRRVRAEELINGTVQRPPSTNGLIATIEMAERRQTGREGVSTARIYERAVPVEFSMPPSGNHVPGGPPPLPPRRNAASSRNFEAELPWHSVSSGTSDRPPSYEPFPPQTDVDPHNQVSLPDNQYADIALEDKRSG